MPRETPVADPAKPIPSQNQPGLTDRRLALRTHCPVMAGTGSVGAVHQSANQQRWFRQGENRMSAMIADRHPATTLLTRPLFNVQHDLDELGCFCPFVRPVVGTGPPVQRCKARPISVGRNAVSLPNASSVNSQHTLKGNSLRLIWVAENSDSPSGRERGILLGYSSID